MLYVQLDVNWVDHPKVIDVGLDGAGLHAMALCLAKRMETDGVLHRSQLARLGADSGLIDRLIKAALFDEIDDRRVRVHGWLDRNPSRGDIAGRSRDGNHKRWGHPGDVEDCPKCNHTNGAGPRAKGDMPSSVPATSHGDPAGIPQGSAPDSLSVLETESETETKTEQGAESQGDDRPNLTLLPQPSAPTAPKRPSKAKRIQALFEVWQEVTDHPGAVLDDKRRKAFEQAMQWFDDDVLADAIRGWRYSPHHTGDNDRGVVYDRVGLVLRDAEQVEKFCGYERNPASRPRRADRNRPTGTETGRRYAPASKDFG